MRQKNIAVLFGGNSPEYGVSLESAYAVLSCMDREEFCPVPIGISPDGRWYRYTGPLEKVQNDTWYDPAFCVHVAALPGAGLLALEEGGPEPIPLDAAFPVLHGKNGEDGTVQGLLELAGVPLVGCGVAASAVCMDKDLAHRLAHAAGVAVPRSFVLERWMDRTEMLKRAEELGSPLFVKPVGAGSSYGITRVKDPAALPAAVELAFRYDDRVILEEVISGFEVGCAVLGNDRLTVGVPDEIELSGGFFDFAEKYTLKTSVIHVPARVPAEKMERVRETAKTVYRALGCRGFARVDMFLDSSGRIVFNEVNTIPGFTAHSRYPNMMRAAGLSFQQVITAVIELALER